MVTTMVIYGPTSLREILHCLFSLLHNHDLGSLRSPLFSSVVATVVVLSHDHGLFSSFLLHFSPELLTIRLVFFVYAKYTAIGGKT